MISGAASQHAAEHVEDGSGTRLARGAAGRATPSIEFSMSLSGLVRSGRAAERILRRRRPLDPDP